MKKITWLVSGLVMMMALPASAAVRLGVLGAVDYSLYNETVGTDQIKGGLGYGGGLMAEIGMGKHAFELAGVFLSREVSVTAAGVKTTSTGQGVHIPGVFRLNLGSGVVGFGLGGYYDYSLETGGDHDYGATASLRFNFGKSPMFFDSRFNYGLKKDSLNKNNTYALGLIGFKFGKGRN